MNSITIRNAEADDFEDIARIYGDEVLHGFATFETEQPSAEVLSERWQSLASKGFPYLVATNDNTVVGYTYAGPYRTRISYRYSIESSIYVAKDVRGQGIGKQLMVALLDRCEQGPWRQMIAIVGDSRNKGSIALHESLGFRVLGTIEAVGFKHNQWVDTVFTQRALGEGSASKPA